MRKTYISVLVAILAAAAAPAFADPGDSGVVDGSNVQQFFGSGFIPDPQQMEEASIPFDKAINIPWSRKRIPLQQPQQQQNIQTQGGTVNNPQATNSQSQSANQQPQQGKKKKKGFFGTVGGAFASTANFLGFPVGEDNDVDATLASDLALPAQQVEDQKTVQREMKREEKQKKKEQKENQD